MSCVDAAHWVVTKSARPGSAGSTPVFAFGSVRVPSSQTFRQDSFELSESSSWPETAPELSVNTASDWLAIGMRNLAESECRSPVSNRQAFTIPEASAKSNANSIMNAVSRLVRLWEKILILAVACSSSRIRTCEGPTFDLDQREVGAQRSSESIRRPCLEDASAPRPLSVRCRTRQRACRGESASPSRPVSHQAIDGCFALGCEMDRLAGLLAHGHASHPFARPSRPKCRPAVRRRRHRPPALHADDLDN